MNHVTYGVLDTVLRSLGFVCRILAENPPTRWYEHPKTGAVVAVPMVPEDHLVSPQHLAAARGTLELFGIAAPPEFAAKLQKAS